MEGLNLQKLKIGIPKAFLYYKYQVMWRSFFEAIGHEIIVSPDTNKEMLQIGNNCSVDESCVSAKVYMGHVEWLLGKCDYILTPRIASYENGDITCTKFFSLYDIVKSTFPEASLLDYNVDYRNGFTEPAAFIKMGKQLGAKPSAAKAAYTNAKKALENFEKELIQKQDKLLETENLKVLLVAHPYNIYDKLIGEPVVNALEEQGADVLYADIPDTESMRELSKKLSDSLYWLYNKIIVGSIEYYKDKIDGIIFLAAFPCGPDSLVIELLMRKLKGIPMTQIVADANFGEAGLQTRIESFVDIFAERKKAQRKPENSGKELVHV
jgi:predicted nucleotide-binding protein (sugar kinase/HSP70/actin superfamily)